MHAHAVSRLARLRGRGRRIADGPSLEIVRGRQECGEGLVDPVDDRAARAEIPPEPLGVKCNATDALALCLKEERDVRLAERIDGLHRVAHAEQAPAICGLPAGYEQLEQSRLGRGGVLVFVDQQVTDPVVERQRELGRCRINAECVARGRGDCRMIEAVAFGEECQQFRDRMRQHRGECIDALPLRVGERRGRQRSQPRERRREIARLPAERFKHRLHFALERRPGRTLACGKESLLAHRPACALPASFPPVSRRSATARQAAADSAVAGGRPLNAASEAAGLSGAPAAAAARQAANSGCQSIPDNGVRRPT